VALAAAPGGAGFHEASGLSPEHWWHLERALQRRVLWAFPKRGLIEEDAAQDMLTWQVSGGFSVDVSVRIEGEDRIGIERLVRYCARGPLALKSLHAPDGDRFARVTGRPADLPPPRARGPAEGGRFPAGRTPSGASTEFIRPHPLGAPSRPHPTHRR
jgi:hypothetical protein